MTFLLVAIHSAAGLTEAQIESVEAGIRDAIDQTLLSLDENSDMSIQVSILR